MRNRLASIFRHGGNFYFVKKFPFLYFPPKLIMIIYVFGEYNNQLRNSLILSSRWKHRYLWGEVYYLNINVYGQWRSTDRLIINNLSPQCDNWYWRMFTIIGYRNQIRYCNFIFFWNDVSIPGNGTYSAFRGQLRRVTFFFWNDDFWSEWE
jgi:hypothetical protein